MDHNNLKIRKILTKIYNCAKFLKEALKSVLDQDLGREKMEIIVVDDCSTEDDPEQVVQEFGREPAHNDGKDGPEKGPVEVAAGARSVAVVEPIANHQNAAGKHGQTTDIRQNLPGTPEAERIHEPVAQQRVDGAGNHPGGDRAQRDETKEHQEV